MRILLLVFAICAVGSIKINTVDGIPLEWLRAPQPGTPQARSNAFPTPVPLRPLNMRTIFRTSSPSARVGDPTVADRLLILEGNALAGAIVRVRLISPTATSCAAPAWTNPLPTLGLQHEFAANGLPFSGANRGQFRAQFQLPLQYTADSFNQQYGQFATRVNRLELPHEYLWPWICVCAGVDAASCENSWIHTNLRYAPVYRCDGNQPGVNVAGDHDPLIPEDFCTVINGVNPNVLTLNNVDRSQPVAEFGEFTFPNNPPSVLQINTNGVTEASPVYTAADNNIGNYLWNERRRKTFCCGFNNPNTAGVVNKKYGVCINPFIEGCCSRTSTPSIGLGKPFSLYREKCCYGGGWPTNSDVSRILAPVEAQVPPEPVIISYLDDWCPCLATRVNDFCNQQFPLNGVTNNCCVKTKYPELADNTNWGKCFDGFKEQCCNTGDIYDPGVNQCCQINGVQSINVPCPCSRDAHCGVNQTCCQDISRRAMFPLPQEDNTLCSPYVNYPTGSGAYQVQPCIGQCIDTRFQICCNGMACQQAFEDCCNNTCCNKFVQRCTIGLRLGAAGKFNNPKDFRVPYEVCTTIEAMTPIRATLMYFGPLVLLLATFLGLALTLFFAKRQNSLQPLSAYEKSMFALACGVILFAWPLYFSALFKYGLALIWTAFFTILAALSQIRGLNIAAVVANGVLLIYLIDPFFGSEIFNLAFSRAPPRSNSVHAYSGVLSSILMLYDNDQSDCQAFYDYFKRDPATEDRLRWDNPHKMSFGFCSRDWFTALGIFEAIALMFVFLLFFVSLITHIRNILFGKAEKTEEVVGWY